MDLIPTNFIGIKEIGIKIVGLCRIANSFCFILGGFQVKLSTKGRYGLRALVDLAQGDLQEPVSITTIANRQGISERYLEQLMSRLKKAGLVTSIRGANGGYLIARDIHEISVGDILRALEGNLEPVECVALGEEDNCASADTCATKYVWQRINASINNTVDEIMLDQLVTQEYDTNGRVNCSH